MEWNALSDFGRDNAVHFNVVVGFSRFDFHGTALEPPPNRLNLYKVAGRSR